MHIIICYYKGYVMFEWDDDKNRINIDKHGIGFETATHAFFDPDRITTIDEGHSTETETRYFCFGKVDGNIMTVRFTLRDDNIRILGAGYWRKGRKYYEKRYNL